ncbi:MAG TPA: cytochrome b N-terminal domain-containing protein, partial [Acidimicrobiales bacterium]
MLAIVSVQVLLLLVSGVVLFFAYRPTGSAVYDELFAGDARSGVELAHIARTAHQLVARSALPTAVLAGVLVALRARPPARRRVDVLVGASLAVVMVVGSFTGYLLPWDQLGLWAVSVGEDMVGYLPLFDEEKVRFVLIGGAEVMPGTVVRWLLVHTLLVGCVLTALLATAWRRSRRPDEPPARTATAGDGIQDDRSPVAGTVRGSSGRIRWSVGVGDGEPADKPDSVSGSLAVAARWPSICAAYLGTWAGPAVPRLALLRVGVASRRGRPRRWCALTAP